MRDDLLALGAALADEYGHGPMDERQQIEGLVQWGRITPQDAEDWLKAQDSKKQEAPFSEQPDPTGFDPSAEPYWTLGMATAWVLWGTADAVREEWADFITRRWRWLPYNEIEAHEKAPGLTVKIRVKGHKLHQGEPKGAWGVIAFASANPTGVRMSPENTKRALVAALQREGDLVAFQGSDEHVREVPAMTWIGLSPFSPGRREQHDAVFARGNPMDPKLQHVRVRSADVMRLWPAEPVDVRRTGPMAEAVVVDVQWVAEEPIGVDPAKMRPTENDVISDALPAPERLPAAKDTGAVPRTAKATEARIASPKGRRAFVEQFILDHPGASIRQVKEAVEKRLGDTVKHSRSTIQGDLAAIEAEKTLKK